MPNENLILIESVCLHHGIDMEFITALQNFGLIELITIENTHYLDSEILSDVEKMINMHYVLDINIEGIDAIFHLLSRIETLQQHLTAARNRLDFSDHVG